MPRYVLSHGSRFKDFLDKVVRGEVVPRPGDRVEIDGRGCGLEEYVVERVEHVVEDMISLEAQLPRVVLK